jgi:hypothetical protein
MKPAQPADAITLQSRETRLIAGDCMAVYDDAGNVIETHEHAGDFREFELRKTRA